MKRKVIRVCSLVLLSVAVSTTLVGCGSKSEKDTASSSTTSTSKVVKSSAKTKTSEKKSAKKWLKNAFISNICFLILVLITPSTNTLYKIFGIGTVLEYIKNSDEAKQLPDNALKTPSWLAQ